MDVSLLRSSFADVAADADAIAARFYERMFATYPQVAPLFEGTDPAEQRRKLVASLATIVTQVDQPDALGSTLEGLGRRHSDYGVEAHHYGYVTASLLATLAEAAGPRWTAELAQTWDAALRTVSARMIEAQGLAAA